MQKILSQKMCQNASFENINDIFKYLEFALKQHSRDSDKIVELKKILPSLRGISSYELFDIVNMFKLGSGKCQAIILLLPIVEEKLRVYEN